MLLVFTTWVLAWICTNRLFLLNPPHRKRVLISCPASFMASRIWSVPSWNQRRTHNRNKVTRKQIQPPLYLKVLGYQSEREEVIWNTKRHQTHSEGLHGGQVEKGQVIQGLGQRESNYLQNSNDTKIPARVWSPSKILWKQGCHPVFGDLLKTEVFIFHSLAFCFLEF